MMEEYSPSNLTEAVSHWHDVLEIRYRHFLQAITDLNFPDSRRHLEVFANLLTTRVDFQDKHLATLDDGKPIQLIEADHMILRNLLGKVQSALVEIEKSSEPRAALIDHLNILVKLMNVLQHHDTRVNESLYTQVEEVLTKEASGSQARQMHEAMLAAMKQRVH